MRPSVSGAAFGVPADRAAWQSFVESNHQHNPIAMRRSRSDHQMGLAMPTLELAKPWHHGMTRRRLLPSQLPPLSQDIRLPAIRPVDGYAKLAIIHAQAEQQTRKTPPAFPAHAPPALLAADVRAKAQAREERRRAREQQRLHAQPAAHAEAFVTPSAAATEKAAMKHAIKKSSFVQQAQDAINVKFTDMFKAFQHIDLDRSGTLNEAELARALDLLNIPLSRAKLKELLSACDTDGDGSIDYKEFVDVLARDTVTVAAMGKRDMQAQEAMGVPDLDKEFLGHKHIRNVKASINETYDSALMADNSQNGTASAAKLSAGVRRSLVQEAKSAINAKFANMRKAFQDIDLDNSGTLDSKELWHAFDRFNIPLDRARFQDFINTCDKDASGNISYDEFVDNLARDTVTVAAMGKRDMQAQEAMGVPDLDKEFLGHKHIRNVKASINNLAALR